MVGLIYLFTYRAKAMPQMATVVMAMSTVDSSTKGMGRMPNKRRFFRFFRFLR